MRDPISPGTQLAPDARERREVHALPSPLLPSYDAGNLLSWHKCGVSACRSERKGPFRMGNHAEEVADYVAAAAALRALGRRVACLLGHSKGKRSSGSRGGFSLIM